MAKKIQEERERKRQKYFDYMDKVSCPHCSTCGLTNLANTSYFSGNDRLHQKLYQAKSQKQYWKYQKLLNPFGGLYQNGKLCHLVCLFQLLTYAIFIKPLFGRHLFRYYSLSFCKYCEMMFFQLVCGLHMYICL